MRRPYLYQRGAGGGVEVADGYLVGFEGVDGF